MRQVRRLTVMVETSSLNCRPQTTSTYAPPSATMNGMVGQTFTRLTVLSKVGSDSKRRSLWLCQCQCGKTKVMRKDALTTGHAKSCGCLFVERRKAGCSLRHGHARNGSRSVEYHTWEIMLQRCSNPNVWNYRYWGGRGISVCERWRTFENFLADVGPRPRGMSIDRINVNGDYKPGNVRWATTAEQSTNKRPMGRDHAGRFTKVTPMQPQI